MVKDLRSINSMSDELDCIAKDDIHNKLFEEVIRLRDELILKDQEISSLKESLDHPFLDKKINDMQDAELICRTQLKLFSDRAAQGNELTSDETKRVEIFAKLLMSILGKDVKDMDKKFKGLKSEDLLSMLEN